MSTHRPAPDHAIRGKPSASERIDQLRLSPRRLHQKFLQAAGHRLHVQVLDLVALHAEPPSPTAPPDPLGEERIVAGRDEVDGGSHQSALEEATLLQRPGQSVAPEVP